MFHLCRMSIQSFPGVLVLYGHTTHAQGRHDLWWALWTVCYCKQKKDPYHARRGPWTTIHYSNSKYVSMLCYVFYQSMEPEPEIEQNWGMNLDEDQRLLKSLSGRASLELFEVCMTLINKPWLDSTCLGASQVIPRTNPQSWGGVLLFNIWFIWEAWTALGHICK